MLSRNFVLIQLMISVLNVNNVFFFNFDQFGLHSARDMYIGQQFCIQGSSCVRYLQFCAISLVLYNIQYLCTISSFVRYLQFYTISLVLYDISSFVRYPQSVSNVLTLYLQVEEKKAKMAYIILPLETNTFSTLVSLYVKPHLISQLYYCRRE